MSKHEDRPSAACEKCGGTGLIYDAEQNKTVVCPNAADKATHY